jgi:hypothetical protein
MGAWGTGSFENDDALDFVIDLELATTFQPVRQAMERVAGLPPSGYLDATNAAVGLAAAEVVAALMGQPADDLPDDVNLMLPNLRVGFTGDDSRLALAVVDRAASSSELRELWDEGDASRWQADIKALVQRLTT